MLRIPSPRNLIPKPKTAINGLVTQAAGVVALAVIQKYVPNVYARWGAYVVAAACGMWYPATRAVLSATKLDQQIESIGQPKA